MEQSTVSIIAVLSAFTALCAVVLGPLVSLWAARQQSRVTVLSANRQTWINSLRDAIAEFVSVASLVSMIGDKALLHARLERMFLIEAKVRLLLNPKEVDHQQLVAAMYAMRQAAGDTIQLKSSENQDKLAAATGAVVPIAQAVLKREWERVKKVE